MKEVMHCDAREVNIRDTAKLCHQLVRTYCISVGDTTILKWDSLNSLQKEVVKKDVMNCIQEFHLKKSIGLIDHCKENSDKKEIICRNLFKTVVWEAYNG